MICSGWRPSHTRVGASGGERHDGTTGGRGTRRRVARPTLEDHPPPAAGGTCCRGGLAWSPRRVRGTGSAVGGEAGMGKTALLYYVNEGASSCRVARAAGVESEMELAFAGLHQLCAPFLDQVGALPGPQREALEVAFGLRDGDRP